MVPCNNDGEMQQSNETRNRITIWYVGVLIAFAAFLFVGCRMRSGNCPAPTGLEPGALTVVPIVYLVLMYLAFVSQE
jgi:hypothetical protein